MIPSVGIDLGTTFSCMSYIDENGVPIVIKNNDGQSSTPSVIWFDGKSAYVGDEANRRKIAANAPIYEFVKRDIGKDVANRYVINGFDYGACGLSALILKKLRIEAFNFFKKKGLTGQGDTVKNTKIPAVITVPAFFGDKQKHETKLAGYAAGLDVIAIINEPTAAALTFGINLNEQKKILVFDLGGGTFDVTILKIGDGEARVITSDGADELGGKDWDKIIEDYLFSEFERQTNTEIPDDRIWDVKVKALKAKFALTEDLETDVELSGNGESITVTLYRERAESDNNQFSSLMFDEDHRFYFEERAQDKLTLCRTILSNILAKANLSWNDIDEIVLAGGSSRMPMIPKLLEKLSNRTIKKNIPGFSLDTAISQGAALFSKSGTKVYDVTSKSIGIELKENNRPVIEHLIKKDSALPLKITQTFPAESNAILKVYEGESRDPDLCTLRGRLELGNPTGKVTIALSIDLNGLISASVEADDLKAELKIKSEAGDIDIFELQSKIDIVDVRL